jgi:putative membrane protein insertion efficiency factor
MRTGGQDGTTGVGLGSPRSEEPGLGRPGGQDGTAGPMSEMRAAGRAQRVVLGMIHLYQGFRSGSVSPCRFYPSCSAYAAEAVQWHGAWRGGLLAARRVARCHPFGGHGVDLVPIEAPVVAKGPR